MAATEADHAASPRDHSNALVLIEKSVVMTLAVTTAEGPWAAPVYYVYRPPDKGFYFFSAPDSRHVYASMQMGSCGAAIFRQAEAAGQTAVAGQTTLTESGAWQQICGLQMRGQLTAAGILEGMGALSRYLKKFPFTRTLLPNGEENLETFRRHFGVRLYRFQAGRIEWTDNRVRFGYRRRLTL
jgi:uncharacterized protein